MLEKRKLAAIMFTDIEGYTSLMQANETQAIHLREAHRRIFVTATEKYGGEILQYYGDGTLSIFDSAVEAVQCSIEMQLSFQQYSISISEQKGIPVRIGIHSGDIIYSEEDIIGDSVNVTSRIESLASAGSVLISDKVYDEIKNQDAIETKSMGWFEFKNVAKHVEVYAISNKGLVVPGPNQMQGKARKLEKKNSLLSTFWNRAGFQMMAIYLIGLWVLVGFTDWMVTRFQISPHWVDVLLIFVLSLLPSLLLHLWNRERNDQRKISFLDRFILPFNLVASALLVFFLFRGTDLGATTQTVYFENENGVEQSRIIIKPNFRKKLALHNFTPEKPDSIYQWMSWGLHGGVAEDIRQNGYMTLGFWHRTESLQEMFKLAKENFYPHMLTGTYSVVGDSYEITSKLYNTQNGTLKKSHTFRSKDVFALIDTISKVTKKDLGFNQSQLEQFVDLPFDQAFTSNLEAYKNYSLYFRENRIEYLERALALDSTFALAHHVMAGLLYGSASSSLGAREAIEQAMRFRKRLPEDFETNLKLTYFQINGQLDKATALMKMQLEINPGDPNLIRTFTNHLYFTEKYDELLAWRKELSILDPGPHLQGELAEALLLNGRFEEAGQTILKTYDQYPNLPDAIRSLAFFYALTGQIDQADSLLQRIVIQDPEIESLADEYFKAFEYAKTHQPTPESLIEYGGPYRLQQLAAEFDISNIENLLYVKGRTQMGGIFLIPSGPDQFMIAKENILERWTFVRDTLGQVYKIDDQVMDRNQQFTNHVLWRQDSLINKAMGLFADGNRVQALEAFRVAYRKNPQHFYLAQFIKHLQFVLDPNNRNALDNMKNYVGRYGPRHIWIENEKIFYERQGQVSKQRLLPLSPDLFYIIGGFQFQMQVVVENGQVKGTVSWEYKNTISEFVRDDDDYIAFDQLNK